MSRRPRRMTPALAQRLAGAVAGGVIGTAQWLALRRIGADVRWVGATALGLAAGLGLGFAIFEYGDTAGEMAVVGAVSGLGIGVAQWWPLRGFVARPAWLWIPAAAVAWALGWSVTTAIGVDPDDRWANPGLSGAATITVLLGLVLWMLVSTEGRDAASDRAA